MTTFAPAFCLSDDDFEDICTVADYSICYWVQEASLQSNEYVIVDEENEQYKITPGLLSQAMVDVATGKYSLRNDIIKSVNLAVESQEYGEIDVEIADTLIQIACFQEVIYG